jgi:hypothetical protein
MEKHANPTYQTTVVIFYQNAPYGYKRSLPFDLGGKWASLPPLHYGHMLNGIIPEEIMHYFQKTKHFV